MLRLARLFALQVFFLGVYHEPALAQGNSEVGTISGKFDVSLSGSSTYAIPLRIAPGAAGTEPKLSIVYDSQSPGGTLGAGWSLAGLSAITRGPKNRVFDGVTDGVRLEETDALYLDGQRMVPIRVDGAGGGRRIEYRKEVDDQSQILQIGSDFASSRFIVRSKGGITILFDGTFGSQVDFSGGPTLLHAASKIIDSSGNTIQFEYRMDGDGDYDVATIRYSGRGSVNADGVFTADRAGFAVVQFSYESASRVIDAYVAGYAIRKKNRLKSIRAAVTDDLNLPEDRWAQVSRYAFDYTDRATTGNRFVLSVIHQFGEDDREITPTKFTYSDPAVGWNLASFNLPVGMAFASRQQLAAAYRFVHFTEAATTVPDLLFAAQINDHFEAFAYQNSAGTWTEAPAGFKPPFPFTNTDGADLGAVLVDLNGDGRVDLIQSFKAKDGSRHHSAYLADKDVWKKADNYDLPFNVSVEGKRVAKLLFGRWSPANKGPDLVYESEGQLGFLENTGAGWNAVPALTPQIPIGSDLRLLDVDCDGKPELVALINDGTPSWKILKYAASGWTEMTQPQFSLSPHIPPTTNLKALLEVQLTGSNCAGLIAAENGGLRIAIQASPTGWNLVSGKTPPAGFDLVDSAGRAANAIVADLDNDGRLDVMAHQADAGGAPIKFSYRQTDASWTKFDRAFEPPALGNTDANVPQSYAFIGDLDGDKYVDIVLPGGSQNGLGRVWSGSSTGFQEVPDYGPKVPFTRKDQQDRGIRVVDLNADGLPDIIFHREVSDPKADNFSKGAFLNTGSGWLQMDGLIPPLPLASDHITGNPVQFVDVDGDGYIDMLYATRRADGSVTRAYYRNEACKLDESEDEKICGSRAERDPRFNRKWVLQEKSPGVPSDLAPPQDFPFTAENVGDLGVRFVDLNGDGLTDMLVGFLPLAGGTPPPTEVCTTDNNGIKTCELNRSIFRVAAFINDRSSWVRTPKYDPPLPFVAQEASAGDRTRDLFVQIIDVDGDRLPDIVAGFKHPYDQTKDVFETWLNTGSGWRLEGNLSLPSLPNGSRFFLDAPLRDPRALVQWADVNSDGLADILFTKRQGGTNESITFLSTGRGFVNGGDPWKIPLDAIADHNGDPSFRLIDVNGDGLLDVLYSRKTTPDQKVSGLLLNNGSGFITADPALAAKIPPFADENGLDQGVRLFDVDGNGLLDVLQAFAGGDANTVPQSAVLLNSGRRSDVLARIDAGYDLTTSIVYQTMLETNPDNSGPNIQSVAPWNGVYVPGEPAEYPTISPVPASYLVRRAVIEEGKGRSLAFSYRYGDFRMHGQAMRSLGFGWRESFNEAPDSQILARTELLQDVKQRAAPTREATCWVPADQLKAPSARKDYARPFDQVFSNLCPSNLPAELAPIRKLAETKNAWTLTEGMVGGTGGLPSRSIRQTSLASTQSSTFELDGGTVSTQTDDFRYDDTADITKRRQNVLEISSQRGDGTSTRTINEYTQDDETKWFFGRLTKSVVTKVGDAIKTGEADRWTETRTAEFGYERITGLMAFEKSNADLHDRAVRIDYRRDAFGNVVSSEASAAREIPLKSQTEYDRWGRFAVAEINPLGHRNERTPRLTTGAPTSVTGPNGLTTRYEYDGFGRVRKEIAATGVVTSTEMITPEALNDADAIAGLSVAYVVRTQFDTLPPSLRILDNKGRLLRAISEGYTADQHAKRPIQSDTKYDILGRTVASTLPYERNKPVYWATARYDRLGRVEKLTAPNKAITQTVYKSRNGGGLLTEVTDPLGRKTSTEVNMRRLPVLVTDAIKGTARYAYDAGDRLTTLIGPAGATTRHRYGRTGQRVETTDPDMGSWKYEYDALGRLIRQRDAKDQITTLEYDLLGRPVRKALNDMTSWWEYDSTPHGVGKLSFFKSSDGYREDYFYDTYGRQKSWSVTIQNETFTTTNQFDRAGRISQIYYPSAVAIENVYDAKGFLVSVRNLRRPTIYWSAVDIDQFGRVRQETFGNGVTTKRLYEAETGRPQRISAEDKAGSAVMDLELTYDLVGNLTRRQEATGVQIPIRPIDETFEYDALDRLVGQVKTDATKERYTFDAAGRITFKSGVGDYSYAPPVALAMAGEDPSAKPFHAVLSTKVGASTSTYGYDLNGNMVRGPTGTFEYSSDNKMKLLFADQARWVRFDYTANGARYRQFERTGINAIETLYIGSYERVTEFFGPLTEARRGRLTRHRHYLANSEGVFATIETNGEYSDVLSEMTGIKPAAAGPGAPKSLIETTKVWYLHRDQLGSVIKITDENARLAAAFWYDPWGKRIASVRDPKKARIGQRLDNSWDRGFTGHEHLDAFSMIHMNGRVYNAGNATFTSVDIVNQAILNTQAGNAYGYTKNNPLRYTDPTGYSWLGDRWEDLKHGAENLGHAIGHAIEEGGKWLAENWKQVLVVAAAVAITTLSGGTLSPIAAAMLSGAVMGAGMAWAYGGSFEDILIGGFTGAVMGGIGYGVGTSFGAGSWGSIGAEGHLGGMQAAMAGGDYWKGFAVGALSRGVSPNIGSVPSTGLRVAARATLSGAIAEIEGRKFANGALSGTFTQLYIDSHSYNWSAGLKGDTAAFVGAVQTTVRTVTGVIGKINAMPLTLAGAVAGSAMVGISRLGWGTGSIAFENNAIQFKGLAFTTDPFTVGNSIIYPQVGNHGWTNEGLAEAYDHERAHTYQYEAYGYRMLMDYGRELGSRGYYDPATGVGNRYEEGAYRYGRNGGVGDSWVPF